MLGLCSFAPESRAEYDEYKVKAAFLLNFAKLVTWPGDTPAGGKLVIGLLGDTEGTAVLTRALEGASLGGTPVEVRHLTSIDGSADCRIVFLARDGVVTPESLLAATRGGRVLTVSEMPGFASQGGMINFFPDGRKLRFEINPGAAEREGLKISSRLLALARVVEEGR